MNVFGMKGCLGQDKDVSVGAIAPAGGDLFATAGKDRCIKLWKRKTPKLAQMTIHCTSSPECLAFSSCDRYLAYGSISGAVKIIDLTTGAQVASMTGHKGSVTALCSGPLLGSAQPSTTWASGSLDASVRVWDCRVGGGGADEALGAQHLRNGGGPGHHQTSAACVMQLNNAHSKTVTALAVSPHGQWVASGSDDCLLKLHDVRSKDQIAEMARHSATVTSIQFHSVEYLLASGSADKTVRFWDLESFECVSQSESVGGCVSRLRFHPDHHLLLTATDTQLRVCDWEPYHHRRSWPLSSIRVGDTNEEAVLSCADVAIVGREVVLLGLSQERRCVVATADFENFLSTNDGCAGDVVNGTSDADASTSASTLTHDDEQVVEIGGAGDASTSPPLRTLPTKIRRSFHEQIAPTAASTEEEESAGGGSSSVATTSVESSPEHRPASNMPIASGASSRTLIPPSSARRLPSSGNTTTIPSLVGKRRKSKSVSSSNSDHSLGASTAAAGGTAPGLRGAGGGLSAARQQHHQQPEDGGGGAFRTRPKISRTPPLPLSPRQARNNSFTGGGSDTLFVPQPHDDEELQAMKQTFVVHKADPAKQGGSGYGSTFAAIKRAASSGTPHQRGIAAQRQVSFSTARQRSNPNVYSSSGASTLERRDSERRANASASNPPPSSAAAARLPPAPSASVMRGGKPAATIQPQMKRPQQPSSPSSLLPGSVFESGGGGLTSGFGRTFDGKGAPATAFNARSASPSPFDLGTDEFMQYAFASSTGGIVPCPQSSSMAPPSLGAGGAAVDERQCLDWCMAEAPNMKLLLDHRLNSLTAVDRLWRRDGVRQAARAAAATNDLSLVADLIQVLNSRGGAPSSGGGTPSSCLWSLDACAALLPLVVRLVDSSHDAYVERAAVCLRLIVQQQCGGGLLSEVIRAGVRRPQTPSIGVDVSQEDRRDKCRRCYEALMSIRDTVHQRQHGGGADAKAAHFKQMHLLLKLFDAPPPPPATPKAV